MVDEICLNDALLEGAKEVFETMIFMDMEKTSEPEQQIEDDALLGTITFMGNLEGCLAICCSQACGKTIAANMLGTDSDEEIRRDDINDAIGEVTNMVMGSVKKRLQDRVGDVNVSIPSVVSGRKLENSLGDHANKILIKVNIEDKYIAEFSLLYRESSG
jgi:chemotaxis protein CheX